MTAINLQCNSLSQIHSSVNLLQAKKNHAVFQAEHTWGNADTSVWLKSISQIAS